MPATTAVYPELAERAPTHLVQYHRPCGLTLRRLEGVSARPLRAEPSAEIPRLLSLQPKDLPQESACVPCATIHPKGLRFPALKRKQHLVWAFDFGLGL